MYIMRQNKKFTWLEVCILGNVRVIWCNTLGDSHFQTYVMNLIELWLITIYLSPHMYFKLLLVAHITQVIPSKLSTWYCVWTCCGHPRLKVPWFYCKMCLKFKIWGQIDWKSCFWKIWVKFKCFWKTFHLILMHFIHKTLCFEEFLH